MPPVDEIVAVLRFGTVLLHELVQRQAFLKPDLIDRHDRSRPFSVQSELDRQHWRKFESNNIIRELCDMTGAAFAAPVMAEIFKGECRE